MPRKTLIKHRRDTKANWALANPILDDGEPGLETNTNRTKIGNGTTKWNSLPYQNVPFYGSWQDFTTQTITANTATPIQLDTTDMAYGISVVNDATPKPTKINFVHAGVYNVQWSGQFSNSDASEQDIVVWLRKGNDGGTSSDIAGSAGHITVPKKHGSINGEVIASWNYLVTVNDDDYIQFYWSATSSTVTLSFKAAGTSPVTPSAASMIVTVQQVA